LFSSREAFNGAPNEGGAGNIGGNRDAGMFGGGQCLLLGEFIVIVQENLPVFITSIGIKIGASGSAR
jgi:hypothetical protein